jgi:DNA-binding CsgD family transcriptional regulator
MRPSVEDLAADVRALGACPTVERFAEESLQLLWAVIPCDGIGFNSIDEVHRNIDLFRSTDPADEAETEEEFWSYADDLPICKALPPGCAGVVRTQDVISARELRSSRIYSDVLRPQGVEYEMKLSFAGPAGRTRAMIFDRGDRPFSDRERDVVLLLAPHLSEVYRGLRRRRTLTERESEVLDLVASGLTNREVASVLDVSPGTVRAHLEHVYAKLNVGTRTAAVAATR